MSNESLTERIAKLSPAKRALLEQRLKQRNGNDSVQQNIPHRDRRDFATLSFAQQRLWFLHQLEPTSPAYNESRALRMKGPVNLNALQRALNQIIARHEVLRTTFITVDGTPMQLVAEQREIDLPVVDLRTFPDP